MEEAKTQSAEFDAYVREAARQRRPGNEIAQAKQLLDSATIRQAEFDETKQQALA